MRGGTGIRWRRWLAGAGLVIVVWFAAGFAVAQRACAHDPRFACSPRGQANPIHVADPQKSWAFYGRLAAGQADVYLIEARRAVRIPVSLLIDVRDAANPGRPMATLVRQTETTGQTVARLTFTHAVTFYEPFSRETYLTTPDAMIALSPGTYRLTVTMPDARTPQRYTLALGSEERFSIGEIPYVIGAIARIRAQRY
jgi:hypothetical protein